MAYELTDFEDDGRCISAAWLRDEMAAIRKELLGKTTVLHYSIFSPWRKQAGCTGSEMVTKRCALLVVFLGTYPKSGKQVCGVKALDLPEGFPLAKLCGDWLAALPDRPERDLIYKALNTIANISGTPEDLKTISSIRTMQRVAKSEGVPLPMGKPIHPKVLRRLIRRNASA